MGRYMGHRASASAPASASAAYPLLYSQLRPNGALIANTPDIRTDSHSPLAPYSRGSLAVNAGPVAGTPYGSGAVGGGVYPGGGSFPGGATFGLYGSDLHGGGVSSELYSRALLAGAQGLGSELHPYCQTSRPLLAPHGRSPAGLLAGRPDFQSYGKSSHAFAIGGSDLSQSYGEISHPLVARGTEPYDQRSLLADKFLSYGGRPDAVRTGRSDLQPYASASLLQKDPDKFGSLHGEAELSEVCRGLASGPQVRSQVCAAQMAPQGILALQAYGRTAEKAGVLTAGQNVASEFKVLKRKAAQEASGRKKKPTLEALIKETWELHSLFRAGLAAAQKREERQSSNGVAEEARRERKAPAMNHTDETGGGWGTPPSPGEAQPATSWDELSKGEPEPTSPLEDLDDLEETSPNTTAKDASLTLEGRQEHLASNLRRIACERVAEFMGNTSDDGESDDEFYTDSDEEAPDPFVRSSCYVKSREEQAYDFFLQLFVENQELQKLYREQCNAGKFECLVCSNITGKPIKRYNGLVSVVMHASKIQKTKKKQEHRGYSRAVCSIMGWDLRKMPAVLNPTSLRPRGCLPLHEAEVEDGDDQDEEKNAEALEEREDDKAKEEDPGLEDEERNQEALDDSDASEASTESGDASEASTESDAGGDNEVEK